MANSMSSIGFFLLGDVVFSPTCASMENGWPPYLQARSNGHGQTLFWPQNLYSVSCVF